MKPKPFASLNHLTVPVDMKFDLEKIGKKEQPLTGTRIEIEDTDEPTTDWKGLQRTSR
jgi:hypothetical protein